MKTKKALAATIVALILLCIASGAVYLRKTYAKIEGRICKTDIKEISPDLKFTKIREINRCTEVERMLLSSAYENSISSFADFEKLSLLSLSFSSVNSSDSRKISTFSSLQELDIYNTDIDFEGFNSSSLSYLCMLYGECRNFASLAECSSLKKISVTDSVIDESIIRNDDSFIMKDSGFLASFDNTTELGIYVDSIEDVSGICEMDSLQELRVNKSSVSDEKKRVLEDRCIAIIEE